MKREVLAALEREIGVLIRRVKRAIGERALLVHPDLQPTGYLILAWLAENGAARSAEVVEAFALDKGAVSRQVQHLEELGLIERTQDPDDRRAWQLALSDRARSKLVEVTESRWELLSERLAEWDAEEIDGLVEMLSRYNQTLEGF